MIDVRDFGAVGDGHALDSPAIQAAIDVAQGGGQVCVPAGRYRCGMLTLHSGVTLLLEAGAVLAADMRDPALYPVISATPHGNKPGQIQALIYADGADGIGIVGHGTIDGGCYTPLNYAESDAAAWRLNATFIRDCCRVRVQNVTFRGIDFWTLHLQRCHDVTIRGVQIDNHLQRYNNDGIDPDGCTDVVIADCNIRTFDDCIVLKSTEGDVCERVTIANCTLQSSGASALKLGTEATGDIRSVVATNCVIHDSDVGIALYMKDGSTYENIIFSGMVIDTASDFPIFIDSTPRYYQTPAHGVIRNIILSDIIVTGGGRAWISGDPARPIEGLSVTNLIWQVTAAFNPGARKRGGTRRKQADPAMIIDTSPAAALLLQHIHGVTLGSIHLRFVGNPDRGLLHMHDVTNLMLHNAKIPVEGD